MQRRPCDPTCQDRAIDTSDESYFWAVAPKAACSSQSRTCLDFSRTCHTAWRFPSQAGDYMDVTFRAEACIGRSKKASGSDVATITEVARTRSAGSPVATKGQQRQLLEQDSQHQHHGLVKGNNASFSAKWSLSCVEVDITCCRFPSQSFSSSNSACSLSECISAIHTKLPS